MVSYNILCIYIFFLLNIVHRIPSFKNMLGSNMLGYFCHLQIMMKTQNTICDTIKIPDKSLVTCTYT